MRWRGDGGVERREGGNWHAIHPPGVERFPPANLLSHRHQLRDLVGDQDATDKTDGVDTTAVDIAAVDAVAEHTVTGISALLVTHTQKLIALVKKL